MHGRVGVHVTSYHCNQQYSITALTNASGTILERYAYPAYHLRASRFLRGDRIAPASAMHRGVPSYAMQFAGTAFDWRLAPEIPSGLRAVNGICSNIAHHNPA